MSLTGAVRLRSGWAGAKAWVAGSVLTDPTNGTVLVDTGALPAGNYLLAVHAAGSVDWAYDLQHRDAANSATIVTQRRRPAAGNEDFMLPNKLAINTNERLRAVLVGNITGEVQVSIFYEDVE